MTTMQQLENNLLVLEIQKHVSSSQLCFSEETQIELQRIAEIVLEKFIQRQMEENTLKIKEDHDKELAEIRKNQDVSFKNQDVLFKNQDMLFAQNAELNARINSEIYSLKEQINELRRDHQQLKVIQETYDTNKLVISTVETYFNPNSPLWSEEFAISASLLIPNFKIDLYGGSSQRKVALLFSLDSLESHKFYLKDSFTSYDGNKLSHHKSWSYDELLNDLIEKSKSNQSTDYSEIVGKICVKESLLGVSIIETGFFQNEKDVLQIAIILSGYMNVPVVTYSNGQIV